MKPRSFLCLLTLCPVLGFLSASSALAGIDPAGKAKEPPITLVQTNIWKRLNLADFQLTGEVHGDKFKNRYPIVLRTKGHTIQYEFENEPLQIRVELDRDKFTVERRSSPTAAWTPVTGPEMSKSILNTDITYEDLGIDFINWDDIQPLGTDSIKTLDAYVFDAKPGPSDHSRFAKVRFWVSSQYWAFLRVDGLNAKDQTVKRVEVQDVMKIGNTDYNVFKEMKVATMMPDRNDIAASTTLIDIKDGHAGSGLTDVPASVSVPDAPNTALPPIKTDTISVAPAASSSTSAAPATKGE